MTGMNWMGIWNERTTYRRGDVVYYQYDGFTYVCAIEQANRYFPNDTRSGFELMAGFVPTISVIDGGRY